MKMERVQDCLGGGAATPESRDLWDIPRCLTVSKLFGESKAHPQAGQPIPYREGGWSGVSLLRKEEGSGSC